MIKRGNLRWVEFNAAVNARNHSGHRHKLPLKYTGHTELKQAQNTGFVALNSLLCPTCNNTVFIELAQGYGCVFCRDSRSRYFFTELRLTTSKCAAFAV